MSDSWVQHTIIRNYSVCVVSPKLFFTRLVISLELLHINSKYLTDARLPYR